MKQDTAVTPQLLTNECAAHYPRLYGLAESLSRAKTVRRHPIVLDLIAIAQEFELWTKVVVKQMGNDLDLDTPYRAFSSENQFGSPALVGERLDFIAQYVGDYVAHDGNLALQILDALVEWHKLILDRTGLPELPKYAATIKCPECRQYSTLRYLTDYLCVNRECCHSWVKN